MARIVINDLEHSIELDRNSLVKLKGGLRNFTYLGPLPVYRRPFLRIKVLCPRRVIGGGFIIRKCP